MTNNDILRRLRYLFNYNDEELKAIFSLVECKVSQEDIEGWLKKEEDLTIVDLPDVELAHFLNGLIIKLRGRKEGPLPIAEDPLTNNMILRKFKIAFELKAEDMIDIYALAGIKISKGELGNFFRNEKHDSFRPVMGQYLRGFMNGLQKQFKQQQKIESDNKAV